MNKCVAIFFLFLSMQSLAYEYSLYKDRTDFKVYWKKDGGIEHVAKIKYEDNNATFSVHFSLNNEMNALANFKSTFVDRDSSVQFQHTEQGILCRAGSQELGIIKFLSNEKISQSIVVNSALTKNQLAAIFSYAVKCFDIR